MLTLFAFAINLCLIILIFLRVPQENVGLASFATKNEMLGPPSSMQRSLNILITIGVVIYILTALQFNFIIE